MPPELSLIDGISANITARNTNFSMFRRLETNASSPVDIVVGEISHRFPALRETAESTMTYGNWLLGQLGIPVLRVPSAPTKPEGDRTSLSINDYMAYCDLPKEEIRSQVFGHLNPFKDVKRRYVFAVAYGQYDAEAVELQDRLREVRDELRRQSDIVQTFEELVKGTPWENRAALEARLLESMDKLRNIEGQTSQLAQKASQDSKTVQLRESILKLEDDIARATNEIAREQQGVEDLKQLIEQLNLQADRLTRTIVARGKLFDIEFIRCPRCGAPVDKNRVAEESCYLCCQTPSDTYSEEDLVNEQSRIYAQIAETKELIEHREQRCRRALGHRSQLEDSRKELSEELNYYNQDYIADTASEIRDLAAARARLTSEIQRSEESLQLYERRDEAGQRRDNLVKEEKHLEAEIEVTLTRRSEVEEKISVLEGEFTAILRSLSLPDFLDSPEGHIDRIDYMPSVNDRKFNTLQSEGLSIEVNVAHALAHQVTAIKLGSPLPSILLVDGVSGAFGEEGRDPQRINAIYEQLRRAADEYSGQLQIIASDTYIPESMRDLVKLELSESERLIPDADLEVLRKRAES